MTLIARPSFAADPLPQEWDLRDLYASESAWAASMAAAETQVPKLDAFKKGFAQSAQQFGAALTAISLAQRQSMRLSTYARLSASSDLRDGAAQQRRTRADTLAGALAASTAWLDPAIRMLGLAKIDAWLAADPTLSPFRHRLYDVLRLAPHALPADEVAALASGSQLFGGPQTIYNQLLGADMPHPTIRLSTGEAVRLDDAGYTGARAVADRGDRKRVFDAFWGSYGAYQNTLGSVFATQAAGDTVLARLAHYDDALDAALATGDTPRPVFTTMIAEARAGIPLLQRYLRLRQRALRLPDLHYYDMYAPLGRTTRTFSHEAARAVMIDSVRPLGRDYGARLSAASGARWVDFAPRPGKYAGSFTNPDAYDVHPYILLNYTSDYQGLTNYVHEWGHAMHSVLTNSKQPFETAHYETFVAEIASTCNEQLLAHHLMDTAVGKQEKLFYIGQLLELLRLNIFREPMLSEFEHAVHMQAANGAPMSGTAMSEIYFKLLKDYHAPVMEIDPLYAMEWSFIPQFYTSYYSFQYATAIAASSYFAEAIRAGDAGVRTRYLNMLAAGGSDYAYNLVLNAGVDLASPEPYRALMRRFEALLDQLEHAIGAE
ncbi:M3 family oligoendopeptidase [Sphingomonas sp. MMS24-J13]|uniref:M3 family oligoendopeptidase n=1 Tax=Sphingomonas sp. MMS24-J13 TaxID=3238686 RepID=UPI00385010E2